MHGPPAAMEVLSFIKREPGALARPRDSGARRRSPCARSLVGAEK
jgi:hypothetical protein